MLRQICFSMLIFIFKRIEHFISWAFFSEYDPEELILSVFFIVWERDGEIFDLKMVSRSWVEADRFLYQIKKNGYVSSQNIENVFCEKMNQVVNLYPLVFDFENQKMMLHIPALSIADAEDHLEAICENGEVECTEGVIK